jgi:hypothetical protein
MFGVQDPQGLKMVRSNRFGAQLRLDVPSRQHQGHLPMHQNCSLKLPGSCSIKKAPGDNFFSALMAAFHARSRDWACTGSCKKNGLPLHGRPFASAALTSRGSDFPLKPETCGEEAED